MATLPAHVLIGAMREQAQVELREYARTHAPHVPAVDVDALANALGEIGFLEAIAALERWEAEHTAPPAPERSH